MDATSDYASQSFSTDCDGGEDPFEVTLTDGEGFAKRSGGDGSYSVAVALDRVWRGQIDGLGEVDAVFLVCGFGASGSAVDVQIFDSSLNFVTSITQPDLYGSYSFIDSTAVEFVDGALCAGVGYWDPQNCHACGPSYFRLFRWAWDAVDKRLIRTEEPRGGLPLPDLADNERRWAQVDIEVNDCGGCVITAYGSMRQGEARRWVSPPVEGGRTRLVIPTEETQSMSFDVTHPDKPMGHFNAVPAIALASRGGEGSREANWCWLGATEAATALSVRHRTVQVPESERTVAGDNIAHIFEADPPLPVVRDRWQGTTDGGLGHQDAPYCNLDSN